MRTSVVAHQVSSGSPARAWSGGSTQQVAVQGTFDELGTPLRDVTFVVVDLETTGGSPLSCAITEIGAVKVRGGEVLGEFQTLVNPGEPIPAFIAVLTGITDTMVAPAPRIGAVLPAFAEFCRGTVLVAHNAPFDVGFLRAAYAAHGPDLAGVPGGRHRPAGPPRADPGRGAELPAVHTRGAVRVQHDARTTAHSRTRGQPSTCCTACSSASAHSACSPSTSSPPSARG